MLKVENLTKSFGEINALDDISFEVSDGEFVFITGPSGAGKTTLIKLILKEYEPDKGKISINNEDITKIAGKNIPKLRQKIGVVFQDYKLLPERTLKENIEVALAVLNLPEKEWGARIDHVLKLIDLEDRKDFFPSQLAGGELQRASMARALVVNPNLILADEPTGNLDWETSDKIMDLFEKINKEGKTIIMATHNQHLIGKMGKRIIKLSDGKLVSDSGSKSESKKTKN